MEEIWKDVVGFEDDFIVSNTGKVRTKKEFLVRPIGKITRVQKNGHFGKDLVGKSLSSKGYPRVNLNGTVYMVHRLVAKAFIPNPDNKPQVNHINGVKIDNRVENLEWVTNQENRDHAVKNNLQVCGEATCNARWTESDIREMRRMWKSGLYKQDEIADLFKTKQNAICGILNYKTWKHVKD